MAHPKQKPTHKEVTARRVEGTGKGKRVTARQVPGTGERRRGRR